MELIAGKRCRRRNGSISPPLEQHPTLDNTLVDPGTGINFAMNNATEHVNPPYAFVISPKQTEKDEKGNDIPGDEHPFDLMEVLAD